MMTNSLLPFRLRPLYRNYVWGGNRLKKSKLPVAEAWIVHESDMVASGPNKRKSLKELSDAEGIAFLGAKVFAQGGTRFPLLIKLLDCAEWLSL
jgi:mannose-6-phosphate isomerase